VEWTAAVGQAVKTDDVIALIETDKVTIDIKADMDGVITQHFGSVCVFISKGNAACFLLLSIY
jgi:pyruvate/2-oxoglutarate dehydrogenase complex dihydrolipoamide acyltransferase (E2) component